MRKIMEKRMLKQAIRACIPSKDMGEYLCRHTDSLSIDQVLGLIGGAPVPLSKKLELFTGLAGGAEVDTRKTGDAQGVDGEPSFRHCARDIEKALTELRTGTKKEAFMMIRIERGRSAGQSGDRIAFFSLEGLLEYLEEKKRWYPKEEWLRSWYMVEKIRKAHSALERVCTYGYIGGEPCYFKVPESEFWGGFWGDPNLNLPVPFHAGDLITIDGRPFCEKKPALVLGVGDNIDCCSVVVLFVGKDGMLWTAPFKHSDMVYGSDSELQISALYRTERFYGELHGAEASLQTAREFVDGNEHKGRCLERDLPYRRVPATKLTKEFLEETVKL